MERSAIRRWPWAALVAASAARVWLADAQSLFAIGFARHDDRRFLLLADWLVRQRWLGPYDNLTLAKGPFYSGWIALTFLAGVPTLHAEQVLYLGACALLALWAIRPLVPGLAVRALLYLILIFNPASFADGMATRVVREGIYPALSLLVVATLLGLVARWDRPRTPRAWIAGLGFSAAAFWTTREEGVWLAPAVLLAVGLGLLQGDRAGWRRRLLRLSAGLAAGALLVAAVAATNWRRYGVATITEFGGGGFPAAYGALCRIEPARWRRWVHVPREARERAYTVSPTFARLRPALEGDIGTWWIGPGCESAGICDEIGGGWLMWAMRDAASTVGFHADARTADREYGRIAAEINAACDRGALACTGPHGGMLPPWRREFTALLPRTLWRALAQVATFRGLTPTTPASVGTPDLLVLFRDLTRERLSGDTGRLAATGWAVAPGGDLSYAVRAEGGAELATAVTRLERPEVRKAEAAAGRDPGGADLAGFTVEAPCPSGCRLVVRQRGEVIGELPLEPGGRIDDGRLRLTLERVARGPIRQRILDRERLGVLAAVTWAYQRAAPWLAALAVAAALVMTPVLVRRGRRGSPLWCLAAVGAAAVAARVAVISLVDVTSFDSVGAFYLSPAFPFLLLFVVCALAAAVDRATPAGPDGGAQ